jgi:predicted dehydrogenase
MKTPCKVAFVGFRHGHIYSLLSQMNASQDFEVTAICEEDDDARQAAQASAKLVFTHTKFEALLKDAKCDVVAIGDYFAKRGSLAIQALHAGKHVISDKPLCTDLAELAEIERLAKSNRLRVGCMLDLRSSQAISCVKRLIEAGRLGRVTQILFTGQHPLNRDSRPEWYFEKGKHGGTITDIASHALDIIPWMTGAAFARVTAAREWQAFDVRSDYFKDAAQMMFVLGNGCGVMGDVSYSAPSTIGYQHPSYWRFTVWGTKGMVEFQAGSPSIRAYYDGAKEPETIAADGEQPKPYLQSFLDDLRGMPTELDTACVIAGARDVLLVQQAADHASR